MAKKEEDPDRPSIYELIEGGKWKRALFTSFTLSLTYFESYLLPRLRRCGCRTIDIYVDAMGHRDSLIEQHSSGAGRDYTPVPVAFRGGIFHPKLIHLWAEEGILDYLIVSSGNLTYSGHGGSIEVIEVLRSDLHAQAFLEAAQFFTDLLADPRTDVGDTTGMKATIERLTQLGKQYDSVENVHFIHSLHASGLDQLVQAAAGETVEEVLVLSPYHHPDGAPVRELMRRTGASRLRVGVDPTEVTTPFPFAAAAAWAPETLAVCPDTTKRRLHAKWYELRAPNATVTLSGSFNATDTSLAKTTNVECGVLRVLPVASGGWLPREVPAYRPQEFPRGAAGSLSMAALASLTGASLEGRILGNDPALKGQWQLTLRTAQEPQLADTKVNVGDDGSFRVQLTVAPRVLQHGAMQLRLERGTQLARGWVALPDLLRLPPQSRMALDSTGNFENATETSKDYADILAILLDETQTMIGDLHPASDGVSSGGRVTGKRAHGVEMTAEEFRRASSQARNEQNARSRLLVALADQEAGWGMLEHLGDILAGFPDATIHNTDDRRPKDPVFPPRNQTAVRRRQRQTPQTQDEIDEAARRRKDNKRKLTQWHEKMMEVRAKLTIRWQNHTDLSDPSLPPVFLAVTRLDRTRLRAVLRAYTGVFDDIEAACIYLGDWMHETTAMPRNQEARGLLLPDIAGASAVLALRCAEAGDSLERSIAARRPPPNHARVPQYLEYFFGGEIDREMVELFAEEWLQSQIGVELVDGRIDAAMDSLRAALTVATPQARIRTILAEKPVSRDPARYAPLQEESLRILSDAIKPPGMGTGYLRVDFRHLTNCPNRRCRHPYRRLGKGAVGLVPDNELIVPLKLYGVARCPGCKTPLLSNDIFQGTL